MRCAAKKPAAKAGGGARPPSKKRPACSPSTESFFAKMPDIADRMLLKLSAESLDALKEALKDANRINMGGACTGSNAPLYSTHVLTEKLGTKHVTETFSCEQVSGFMF